MIIAIDGYEANEGNRVGIGEYAYQTLLHLHALISKQQKIHVRVYLPSPQHPDMPRESAVWQYKVRKPKRLWTFGGLPVGILTDFPIADVVFSPTHYIPRYVYVPRVLSIMDLSFLSFPEMFNKKDYFQLKNWTEYSVRHAKAIFTISEFSRNAIINHYNFPPERVFVTYPGFSPVKGMKAANDVKKKYELGEKFILSVGTIQPRKNYERLIEAFSLLRKKTEFSDIQLVIVGKKGWLYESILAAPEKFGVEKEVRFLDFVPDQDLPSLYIHAQCLAMVSLYEGFGLPVLEAMANGCVVVVSDVSSLPEIAGEAGVYVQPDSPESITKGLEIALKEKRNNTMEKRVQLGKKQVQKFSWTTAAEQTLEVLQKVGAGEI